MFKYAKKIFHRAVHRATETLVNKSTNVQTVADYIAARESAEYYSEKMLNCSIFDNASDLLTFALGRVEIPGLFCEFGVASGRTINHIATICPDKTIHGFDGFSGLPEHWRPGFGAGTFAGPLPDVRENVMLHVGLFDANLPSFTSKYKENAAFIHVDCDLYSSTKAIFSGLSECIVPGTVIVFDEYFNYPGWKRHEWLAFQEFVTAREATYRYIGLVPSHQQVAVIVDGLKS